MPDIPRPHTSLGVPLYETLTALETVSNQTARNALHRWLSEQLSFASEDLQTAEAALYEAARSVFFRHAGEVVETLLKPKSSPTR